MYFLTLATVNLELMTNLAARVPLAPRLWSLNTIAHSKEPGFLVARNT